MNSLFKWVIEDNLERMLNYVILLNCSLRLDYELLMYNWFLKVYKFILVYKDKFNFWNLMFLKYIFFKKFIRFFLDKKNRYLDIYYNLLFWIWNEIFILM